jgi:hypothetical protein
MWSNPDVPKEKTMHTRSRRLALYVWLTLLSSLYGPQAQAQKTLLIDDFKQPPMQSYVGYAPPPVEVQEGYGLYYETAHIQLTRVQALSPAAANAARTLQLQYTLPPAFAWGNWLSLRREFALPLDLSAYEGVELTFKVASPSNALLRITLSDLEEGSKSGDEMWWFDCPPETLKNATTSWQTIRIPFRKFSLSWGAGTRHNDRRWNASRVVAYEVNILSPPREQPQGAIVLESLQAFP